MSKKLWLPGMQLRNANGDIDPSTFGYQYAIQTTTQIRARVVEQKFYELPPADFVPIAVGTGAWMEQIKTNLVYDIAAPFETGIISTASGPSRLDKVDVGSAPVTSTITTWAKGYEYAIPEVEKALASNNWDVVNGKLRALKRQWDLGIQKIAFLGLLNDLTNSPGLYTQPNVNTNTAVIATNISAMNSATFATLVAGIMGAYFTNSNSTVLPDTFVIPMDDYLGLATPVASGFPIVSQLTYLEDAFKRITGNAGFKIAGVAYGTAANNANYINGATGKQRYVLYRKNPDTLTMDIPVDFNLSPAGTSNNFNWEGVGYGQFSGVVAFRPAEMIYFDHN